VDDWIRSLPKVELHLHLDCSAGLRTLRTANPSLTAGQFEDRFVPPARIADLPTFLDRAAALVGELQTEQVLRVMVEETMDGLAADGVVYAEPRFAPHQHTAGGLDPHEVVSIVESQLRFATFRTGVEARLILCTLMHYPVEVSIEVAELTAEFRGTLVTGFDVAGDAVNYELLAHKEAFTLARERGVSITVHAGEADGPDSVWVALDELGADRIGHGIRAVEDQALLDRLARERTHLEICPRCNVQIGTAPSIPDHPVHKLREAGVSLGISSDSRTLTGSIVAEYASLVDETAWEVEWMRQANLDAIEASFVEQSVKDRIAEGLREWSPNDS
jgi:adenosine deaminase